MTSRLSSYKRALKIDLSESRSAILYGPRKVGKTTFLKLNFPKAVVIDLLKSEVRAEFQIHPEKLRQVVLENPDKLYIIDEIQKTPQLLDEVHWCLENTEAQFILCGSSARKLKRGAANLLGGRAFKYDMFPLTTKEIPDYDCDRIIQNGSIPQHYNSKNAQKFLKSYVDQYLQEEIIEESKIRNLASFNKFLQVAALMNGELLNYANVGSDCGVSGKTVREYYQILEDTLLGFTLQPWAKVKTRKLIETAKFYLFDVGVIRYLKGISHIPAKTFEYGNSFETLMINEVRAYISYHDKLESLAFWKTTSGFEVDLIIGNMKLACEFKSTDSARKEHLKGLNALLEEQTVKQCYLISMDPTSRQLENGIRVLHYKKFLKELWSDKLF